jgi:hypothetical protein
MRSNRLDAHLLTASYGLYYCIHAIVHWPVGKRGNGIRQILNVLLTWRRLYDCLTYATTYYTTCYQIEGFSIVMVHAYVVSS